MSATADARARELDATLAALSDPTRRGVVDCLGRRPHRAGELAARFGLSPPAMSRHLRVLRQRGLIDEARLESDARVRLYRLRPERLRRLRCWLQEMESFWSEQLESFRVFAEDPDGGAAP